MIRGLALLLIRAYQLLISPLLHPCCRFVPSCSAYAAICIERFGVARGSVMALKRLIKCHPWGPSGYYPPPECDDTAHACQFPLFLRKTKIWIGK